MPASSDEARRERHAAAAAARQYLDGEISYDELKVRGFYDSGDYDIGELFDLITHEPSRRGFLGVSDSVYLAYRQQVLEVVRRLEMP